MTHPFTIARHLGEGYKRDDVSVLRLMDRVNVFILPMVDADGFDPSSAGKQCAYDHQHLGRYSVLSRVSLH